jgi:hypothetical protein
MPITRLLALVMFLALCAALALGQSQQNDSSNLVVFQGAASMNSPNGGTDQRQSGPESQVASSQPSAGDSSLLAKAGDDWRGSQHSVSNYAGPNYAGPNYGTPSFPLDPESDKTCYFIRDYVVIRDSPHSDSVHRDGSFTCVPGSRFRVYTTGR